MKKTRSLPSKISGSRKALVVALLAALTFPAQAASTASAAATCSTKSDTGWVVVQDFGRIGYFKKAERGVRDTELSDAAAFKTNAGIVVAKVIEIAGSSAKLKIVAKGGADAAGNATSNVRIAKNRARYGARYMRSALSKAGVKSVSFTYEHTVSAIQDDPFARFFGLTVFRCDPTLLVTTPTTVKPTTPTTTPTTGTKCAPPLTTLVHTETFRFLPAKRSLREGLTPEDRDTYTSRMVYVANVVKGKLTSPGGVYVEVTGYASPAGSAKSNDWLAANRAKTAESSLRRALTRTLKASDKFVTFKTAGASERRTDPTATITVYYCP
jgi:hypothetical protein